jgi:lipopolysaccharide export system protein LptC
VGDFSSGEPLKYALATAESETFGVTTAYPLADAAPDTGFPVAAGNDYDQTYRSALRHSRHVRVLRVVLIAGIGAVLFGITVVNYLPQVGEIRIPGAIGNLVIKGTKITMQHPQLTGYTTDARPYEFTANTADQDINKPDLVEMQQLHARLQMEDKSTVEMTAPTGTYDMKADKLFLYEDIALASSTGYAARLNEATIDIKSGNVTSDKPVWVKLLNGNLTGKHLEITNNGEVIRFDGGVTMILHPDQGTVR